HDPGGRGRDMRARNVVDGKWNFELVKRRQCRPGGLWGGNAGEFGTYLLREPGEREFAAARGVHRPVPVGSEVIVRTGGGGGWGDPLERDANAGRTHGQEEGISPRAPPAHYRRGLAPGLTIHPPPTQTPPAPPT